MQAGIDPLRSDYGCPLTHKGLASGPLRLMLASEIPLDLVVYDLCLN